jgi:dienelactone hydrolase
MKIQSIFFTVIATFILSSCAPTRPIPVSFNQLSEQLTSHYRVFKPDTPAPYKTILFFHGANDLGWYEEYEIMLKRFANKGYAAVYVDMFAGRGAKGDTVRRGALLPTATAGDVFISLAWLRKQPWADPNKVVAWGSSFGGTTLMDAMVFAAEGKLPLSLKDKPSHGLKGLRAIALLAPWCADDVMGFNLIASVHENFSSQVPTIAILPGSDAESSVKLCKSIFDRNKSSGANIQIIDLPDAGHTFFSARDDYGQPFADYSPSLARQAEDAIFKFFEEHLQ